MKTGLTRVSAFLMSAVLLIGMTGCSGNKKTKEMKKTAEGVVENYLVFLATGKYDKLSRYCDPENDQFQDILKLKNDDNADSDDDSTGDIYPEPDYLPFWQAYLSHTKFTFGEFTLDGDEGKLDVSLDLIDAKKALRSSINPSSDQILNYLQDADTYTTKPITLTMDCDTDSGKCKIKDTKVLFKECKKQFDIILKELPVKNPKLDAMFKEFMDHMLAMDMDYLDNDGFYLGFDPSEYAYSDLSLYRAMTELYTYDYEFVAGSDDWAEFKMTVHKKDEADALLLFFASPANWAPSYKKMLKYALEAPVGFNGLEDLWPIDEMAPGLQSYMQNRAKDKDYIVRGEIRIDQHVSHGYRMNGEFEDAFPAIIEDVYMVPSSTPDFIDDAYREAMQQLLSDLEISQQEYDRLYRMLDSGLTDTHYSEVMEKHGYTMSLKNHDGFNNYSKDSRITFEIVKEDSVNGALITGLQDYTEIEAAIADGSYTGNLSGGWMSYEFRGQKPEGDAMKDAYERYIVFSDHGLKITVTDCTDADVDEINTILSELGLY